LLVKHAVWFAEKNDYYSGWGSSPSHFLSLEYIDLVRIVTARIEDGVAVIVANLILRDVEK
jgi:hypothetical protein